ncbi:alpha-amylase [Clostridiaceae bacterium Marseille-Q4145]|nr:alpha-amylase [Clostridiaceae bacterium Marseille-Q4145]
MAWYDEAVFYHIYPLGLTGAPKQNDYGEPIHRLNTLVPWIEHIKKTGFNALYIGPLFESVGHGYETTDYKKLDSRLGTNEDLKAFVKECHEQGIRVIFDGVFNHTGRDFFAFKDLQKNREQSPYKDWYCNVNFQGNNEYNDGFSYENWGGYNLLVKLNQHNPAVRDYICDVIRYWVSEFDVDGIRLDAADVLDFEYMKALRRTANEVKPDFWLMGEVIHGDYSRWVNEGTLHSVTNYQLHKALYSGHNDHNYFEIAHTVKRLYEMGGNRPEGLKLYNFVDNHDVERIYTKLQNKAHFTPVHILLYTLPGVPSVYYGSEFGIEGKKERYSDDSIRPALNLADYANAAEENPCTKLIAALGRIRQHTKELSYGDYKELMLQNRQYAFSRTLDGKSVIVMVNNDDNGAEFSVPAGGAYVGALSGRKVSGDGQLRVQIDGNSGEIWIPAEEADKDLAPVELEPIETSPVQQPIVEAAQKKESMTQQSAKPAPEEGVQMNTDGQHKAALKEETVAPVQVPDKPYEEMTVEELQQAVFQKLAKNGPVTEQMKKDVADNVYHDSLVNWVKSFR